MQNRKTIVVELTQMEMKMIISSLEDYSNHFEECPEYAELAKELESLRLEPK